VNSQRAIEVNIRIIRIFTKLREILFTHQDILLKLEQIEKAFSKQNDRQNKQEEDIQLVFTALKQLLNPPNQPRKSIGFKTPSQNDEI